MTLYVHIHRQKVERVITTLSISDTRCVLFPNIALIFYRMIFFSFFGGSTVAQADLELIVQLDWYQLDGKPSAPVLGL